MNLRKLGSVDNLPRIRLDLTSTAYFFGRWVPFAIAIGIVTGSIASLMDFLIVGINNILRIRVWFLFLYPLLVSVIVGIAIHLEGHCGTRYRLCYFTYQG